MNEFYNHERASRTNAVRQQWLLQMQHRQRKIPPGMDLRYVATRLLAAPIPSGDEIHPRFTDTGRNIIVETASARLLHLNGLGGATSTASISEPSPAQVALYSNTNSNTLEESSSHHSSRQQQQQQQLTQQLYHLPLPSPSQSSLSSSRAPPLDVYTQSLMGPPGTPAELLDDTSSWSLTSDLRTRESIASQRQQQQQRAHQRSSAAMATFLRKRHGNFMFFALSSHSMDDQALSDLNRQVVYLPWHQSTTSSETPTLAGMLHICYALKAWLDTTNTTTQQPQASSPRPVAVVGCSNGKTRTAIVVACFLKYQGLVQTTQEGFLHFLSCQAFAEPHQLWKELPTSLRDFFANFDDLMNMQHYVNRKPLMLRAVGIQGVPVEDKPCLDLWSADGTHLYSSHHAMEHTDTIVQKSEWGGEEGFYRVNQIVKGDFCMLCRFGGTYAADYEDSSKIIFRYANTTAYLGGTTMELGFNRVDVMRRYAHLIEPQEFLLTLVWEAAWNCTSSVEDDQQALCEDCSPDVLPPILFDLEAMELGWHTIVKYHAAKPIDQDVDQFLEQTTSLENKLSKCPRHLVSLALQLANFDTTDAEDFLLSGRLRSWWSSLPEVPSLEDEDGGGGFGDDEFHLEAEHAEARDKILDLLGDIGSLDGEVEWTLERGPPPSRFEYASPTMEPIPGDIYNAFGFPPPSLDTGDSSSRHRSGKEQEIAKRPELPMVPRYKRTDKIPLPIDDPANCDAVEIIASHNDPHLSLQDVHTLLRTMGGVAIPTIETPASDSVPLFDLEQHSSLLLDKSEPDSPTKDSTTISATRSGERDMQISKPAQADLRRVIQRQRSGASDGDENKESTVIPTNGVVLKRTSGGDSTHDVETNNEDEGSGRNKILSELFSRKSVGSEKEAPVAEAEISTTSTPELHATDMKPLESRDDADEKAAKDVPLKDDACFSKYFKMLKVGLPRGAVENAMTKDGADLSLLDLDPERSLSSQRVSETSMRREESIPLKDDLCFSKYYKMLKVGLPRGAVENAMTKDGADTSLLDLDPERSLSSQRASGKAGDSSEIPLKADPSFVKYYKMSSMGLPRGAVENAMTRDGADLSLLDLDPEKSLSSQRGDENRTGKDSVPLKEDPRFSKYFKMSKMGLPRGAIENAMTRDGADLSLLDLDPEESLEVQRGAKTDQDGDPSLKDDPCFVKYYRMLKMGLPKGAVENAMVRDGADVTLLDLDPEKSLASQTGKKPADSGPQLKDDACFSKYYKMLKMGLPRGAVENAMMRDGADTTLLELDPDKSLRSQRGDQTVDDSGPPLKEDPCFSKYYKMLKMGLPRGAVENAMTRDSADISLLDLDPEKSLASQKINGKSLSSSSVKGNSQKKKRVRRKKIYWNPIDPGTIKKNSLWSLVKGQVQMDNLDYDLKEFEDLFTESTDAADKKKKAKSKEKSNAKKVIQVIDGKRSMNGGIILKRLKMDFADIAKVVDMMEHDKIDPTSLVGLKDFLPTHDERQALIMHMKKGGDSEKGKTDLLADLSECEKYMYSMLDVADAEAKFDCLIFRSNFNARYKELENSIATLRKACDEVRSSDKLRQIIAMILTLVNQINTGGDGNGAAGFSLDALLKLNEAKAFDRKTSVLQYLAKLIKRNDASLLDFPKDLSHSPEAENILMDSLMSDIKVFKSDVGRIHVTVVAQAEELQESGQSKPLSLEDLMHQKSNVRNIQNVPQYNKIDHLTGRTSMERFALKAASSIDELVQLADEVRSQYLSLLEFFGEDEKMASNDFFGTINRFMSAFGASVDHVEREEKKKEREEKRKAASAQHLSKKAPSKSAQGPKSGVTVTVGANEWSGVISIGNIAGNASTLPNQESANEKQSSSGSSIAAMAAAAAAAKKVTRTESESRSQVKRHSSIAELAVASVASKDKGRIKPSSDKNAERTERGPLSLGSSLAAMAAAAAAASKSTGDNLSPSESKGPTSLAAMAAAAASKRSIDQKASEDKSENKVAEQSKTSECQVDRESTQTTPVAASQFIGSDRSAGKGRFSLAAMAAASAAKRANGGKTTQSGSRRAADGSVSANIAAMAAAAAASKSLVASSSSRGSEEMSSIAEMAAASGANRSSDKETTTTSEEAKGEDEGFGISVLELVASASNTESKESDPRSKEGPSSIAAMAAAAAASKSLIASSSSRGSEEMSSIAEMAAASDRNRSRDRETTTTSVEAEGENEGFEISVLEQVASNSNTEPKGSDPRSKEGPSSIAAMAAAAAASKSLVASSSSRGSEEMSSIAEIAAASGANRSSDKETTTTSEEVEGEDKGFEISVLEQVASNSNTEPKGSDPQSKEGPSSIAAMAAAAAASKSLVASSSSRGSGEMSSIAEMAEESDRNRSRDRETTTTSEEVEGENEGFEISVLEQVASISNTEPKGSDPRSKEGPSSIAAMAAAAAASKSLVASSSSRGSEEMSSIAEMAAASGANRSSDKETTTTSEEAEGEDKGFEISVLEQAASASNTESKGSDPQSKEGPPSIAAMAAAEAASMSPETGDSSDWTEEMSSIAEMAGASYLNRSNGEKRTTASEEAEGEYEGLEISVLEPAASSSNTVAEGSDPRSKEGPSSIAAMAAAAAASKSLVASSSSRGSGEMSSIAEIAEESDRNRSRDRETTTTSEEVEGENEGFEISVLEQVASNSNTEPKGSDPRSKEGPSSIAAMAAAAAASKSLVASSSSRGSGEMSSIAEMAEESDRNRSRDRETTTTSEEVEGENEGFEISVLEQVASISNTEPKGSDPRSKEGPSSIAAMAAAAAASKSLVASSSSRGSEEMSSIAEMAAASGANRSSDKETTTTSEEAEGEDKGFEISVLEQVASNSNTEPKGSDPRSKEGPSSIAAMAAAAAASKSLVASSSSRGSGEMSSIAEMAEESDRNRSRDRETTTTSEEVEGENEGFEISVLEQVASNSNTEPKGSDPRSKEGPSSIAAMAAAAAASKSLVASSSSRGSEEMSSIAEIAAASGANRSSDKETTTTSEEVEGEDKGFEISVLEQVASNSNTEPKGSDPQSKEGPSSIAAMAAAAAASKSLVASSSSRGSGEMSSIAEMAEESDRNRSRDRETTTTSEEVEGENEGFEISVLEQVASNSNTEPKGSDPRSKEGPSSIAAMAAAAAASKSLVASSSSRGSEEMSSIAEIAAASGANRSSDKETTTTSEEVEGEDKGFEISVLEQVASNSNTEPKGSDPQSKEGPPSIAAMAAAEAASMSPETGDSSDWTEEMSSIAEMAGASYLNRSNGEKRTTASEEAEGEYEGLEISVLEPAASSSNTVAEGSDPRSKEGPSSIAAMAAAAAASKSLVASSSSRGSGEMSSIAEIAAASGANRSSDKETTTTSEEAEGEDKGFEISVLEQVASNSNTEPKGSDPRSKEGPSSIAAMAAAAAASKSLVASSSSRGSGEMSSIAEMAEESDRNRSRDRETTTTSEEVEGENEGFEISVLEQVASNSNTEPKGSDPRSKEGPSSIAAMAAAAAASKSLVASSSSRGSEEMSSIAEIAAASGANRSSDKETTTTSEEAEGEDKGFEISVLEQVASNSNTEPKGSDPRSKEGPSSIAAMAAAAAASKSLVASSSSRGSEEMSSIAEMAGASYLNRPSDKETTTTSEEAEGEYEGFEISVLEPAASSSNTVAEGSDPQSTECLSPIAAAASSSELSSDEKSVRISGGQPRVAASRFLPKLFRSPPRWPAFRKRRLSGDRSLSPTRASSSDK